MSAPIKPKKIAFRVGPLPAALINRALKTELEPADVWVSKACHEHIANDHPEDYKVIKANIIDILLLPTYAGQDAKSGKGFYLVKRIALEGTGREFALVAIALERSRHGTYNVKSAYTIDQADVNSRRLKGGLKILF